MSGINTNATNQDYLALEAENKRLSQKNQKLARQAEDIATANAHAAELMVKLEELNEDLKIEIEKRKTAEQKLRQINREIEETVRQRTAELTAANERLIDEIRQRGQIEQTLREHKQRLDTILSVILTGVVIVDSETHEIVDVNTFAAKMIGLPKEQIIGKICHQFICPAEISKCPISDLSQTVDQSECVLLRPNNQKIPILKSVTTTNWQGREYLVESFLDISEQKKTEQHQAQLLQKLENINKDLNELVYIISHDLKTPLRGISTLVNWLSTDYANKFDQEDKDQINLLLNRVARMYSLIDGVLHYSEIGRIKEERTQVDLNQLVPNIINGIALPDNIEITIENKLPNLICSRKNLTRIFQNLLSNSITYIDKPRGWVKIDCIEEDGFWKLSVADNGPGIEEKYFEKIFQMFQTLSPWDEVESTGVGLTIVKKIIEMHGGKIWVESKVGQGSTFYFTLPKQELGVQHAELQANIAG